MSFNLRGSRTKSQWGKSQVSGKWKSGEDTGNARVGNGTIPQEGRKCGLGGE